MSVATVDEKKDHGYSHRSMRPPVKVACTSCRASRTRCDGNPVCSSCLIKGKDCLYLKSNRGGPRISHKKARQQQGQHHERSSIQHGHPITAPDRQTHEFPAESCADLVDSMIAPGAGLLDLDGVDGRDDFFRSMFSDWQGASGIQNHFAGPQRYSPSRPRVRHYEDDTRILNAYYIFIHPYFPILPPPVADLGVDIPLHEPPVSGHLSPLLTAFSAVLALIPHPQDPHPTSSESARFRREGAHDYCQQTMNILDQDIDLVESSLVPSEALNQQRPAILRDPVHPGVPVELESVLAYLVMSVYEYAQRGNLAKMRNRASQAYDAAVRLALHDAIERPGDELNEARRRAWWMTCVVLLQASIVSGTPPIVSIGLDQYRTPFPTIGNGADVVAWPFFLEAQQCIFRCTQFSADLSKLLDAGQNLNILDHRKSTLDAEIDSILSRYLTTPHTTNWTIFTSPMEQEVGASLRLQALIKLNSAKIKLHRYQAFQNAPIFSRRHCDLEKTGSNGPNPGNCSCRLIYSAESGTPPPKNEDMDLQGRRLPEVLEGEIPEYFPMSVQEGPVRDLAAVKICLEAALTIGRAFEALPLPNPMRLPTPQPPTFLSSTSLTPAPRTMPSFACCAMQSCYSLLSICYRYHDLRGERYNLLAVDKQWEELYAGISRVLAALENYAIAFEALSGMTEQIEDALHSVTTSSD